MEAKRKDKDLKKVLSAMLIMLLITIILIGGTYAFFTAIFTGVEDDTTITVGGGTLGIHMDGGNIITMHNIYPREEAWEIKRFTITGNNNTILYMEYFLNLIVTENTFAEDSLTYTLDSQNTSNTGGPARAITNQTGIPTGAGIHSLGRGIFYEPGVNMVHTYYLTFYFPSRGVPQNEDQGATFRAHVGISGEGTLTAKDLIKDNNQLRENIPNFAIPANNANRNTEEGLFETTDEHGTAYFFRGTHDGLNNNVIFAGHQWKILRIEGNGNIRMIYNGLCTLNPEGTNCLQGINSATAGANATIGSSVFNTQINHNRFVGYMFGSEIGTFNEQHANINNSVVKEFVDNWFNDDANITSAARNLIATDTVFCNDRSIAGQVAHGIWAGAGGVIGTGLNTSRTVFGTVDRMWTPFNNSAYQVAPTLICPRAEDRLEMTVGLLINDETAMAGGTSNHSNLELFLRNGEHYWTMSPSIFDSTAAVLRVNNNGGLQGGATANTSNGVRPVLSLNSNVIFSTGNGSVEAPFVVSVN